MFKLPTPLFSYVAEIRNWLNTIGFGTHCTICDIVARGVGVRAGKDRGDQPHATTRVVENVEVPAPLTVAILEAPRAAALACVTRQHAPADVAVHAGGLNAVHATIKISFLPYEDPHGVSPPNSFVFGEFRLDLPSPLSGGPRGPMVVTCACRCGCSTVVHPVRDGQRRCALCRSAARAGRPRVGQAAPPPDNVKGPCKKAPFRAAAAAARAAAATPARASSPRRSRSTPAVHQREQPHPLARAAVLHMRGLPLAALRGLRP
eukprot:gene22555-biopygen20753